jgi:hypothetical protein
MEDGSEFSMGNLRKLEKVLNNFTRGKESQVVAVFSTQGEEDEVEVIGVAEVERDGRSEYVVEWVFAGMDPDDNNLSVDAPGMSNSEKLFPLLGFIHGLKFETRLDAIRVANSLAEEVAEVVLEDMEGEELLYVPNPGFLKEAMKELYGERINNPPVNDANEGVKL